MKKTIAALLRKMAKVIDPPETVCGQDCEPKLFTLRERNPQEGQWSAMKSGSVSVRNDLLEIFVEGYGSESNDCPQGLLIMDVWDDRLRLVYWSGSGAPQLIDLEDARTSRIRETRGG